jgi:uncharacterized protein (DUF58 family)
LSFFKKATPLPKPSRKPVKSELHRTIKRLEIKTVRLVHTIFGGEYKSVFKARGLEFDEVREYQEGDDPRLIDWNVTARMDRLFVKKFVEERELTVMLLVDVSASHQFGSHTQLKRDLAAEITAAIALSALKNNDRVGLILFSDRIERHVAPRKGRNHVNRLLHDILSLEPKGLGTDYQGAVSFLMQVLKQKAVVFLLSDFLSLDFERPLRQLATRHDVISVVLVDPRELSLPDIGLVRLEDPETGERIVLDTHSPRVRAAYADRGAKLALKRSAIFRSLGLDFVSLSTAESYVLPLIKFFQARQARRVKRKGLA